MSATEIFLWVLFLFALIGALTLAYCVYECHRHEKRREREQNEPSDFLP